LEDEESEERDVEQHDKEDNGKSTSTDDSAPKKRPAQVSEYVVVQQDCNFVAHQEDAFPLPPLEDVDNYKWAPLKGEVIQTMTDYTLACQKACRKVWSKEEEALPREIGTTFFHGSCLYHVWNAWHRSNRSMFRNHDKNKKQMSHDFEAYKCSPWVPMIPLLRDKMMDKWRSQYRA
jgi:hypothetical protein